jgi:alkylation response protein AidB-like acyl-CoA dehydrogenase
MDFIDSPTEAAFRTEIKDWLNENLKGDFAELGGRGGPADEHGWDIRIEWEKLLGKDRWLGLTWPIEYGGRNASFSEQIIFSEEYALANAPARVSFFGEGLFAPTLLAYGTDEQKRRFLPKIQSVEELWCQGYSEPDAGSDLANVKTKGVLDGDQWVVNGQKVWTTLAHRAQWCFCITRTDPDSQGHQGLSYLLIPMDQPGVEVRPLVQMTGTAEFNEVFFADARTDAGNVLGAVGDGWKVAMATLGFERGTAFLSQQLAFARELEEIIALAQANEVAADPVIR